MKHRPVLEGSKTERGPPVFAQMGSGRVQLTCNIQESKVNQSERRKKLEKILSFERFPTPWDQSDMRL